MNGGVRRAAKLVGWIGWVDKPDGEVLGSNSLCAIFLVLLVGKKKRVFWNGFFN